MNGPDYLGADPLGQIARLRDLADALGLVHGGWRPDPEELAAMPLLRGWSFRQVPEIAFAGRVYGHPALDDGVNVLTSPVQVIDRHGGWARTASRFYRLGPPAMEGLV